LRAKSSYTVSELAGLSKQSESKIRRLIDDGRLALADDSRPRRVAAISAHEYLRGLIADGPQLPDGADLGREPSATDGEVEAARRRIVELEQTVQDLEEAADKVAAENEKFRNSIQGLRHSQGILLDDLGQYTSPKLPNN
jgi:hypothetical protein